MELLQVFDNDKNMLDESVERDKKLELPDGKNFMIILLFIQNDEDKFLIQKTSSQKQSVYATTGGHVTFGDNNIETAIKECEEELGVKLNESDLVLVDSERIGCTFVDTFYCKKNIDLKDITLQEEEVESIFWMSLEEIYGKISEGTFRERNIPRLEKVKKYLAAKK